MREGLGARSTSFPRKIRRISQEQVREYVHTCVRSWVYNIYIYIYIYTWNMSVAPSGACWRVDRPWWARWAFLRAESWIKIINGKYIRTSKRRLIYGNARRYEAGPVISQKPRICGLGLDFCFYPDQPDRLHTSYLFLFLFRAFSFSLLSLSIHAGTRSARVYECVRACANLRSCTSI